VPIHALLKGNGVFTPEEVNALTTAFEDCLVALGLADRRNDPAAILLAERIIDVATNGERNAASLRDAVLKSFRSNPGVSGL
jgi:hypothetical protein